MKHFIGSASSNVRSSVVVGVFFEELGLTFNEEDICCPQAGILQSPPCFTRFGEDPIDIPSKW